MSIQTIPCDECRGEGYVPVQVCCGRRTENGDCCGDADIDFELCPRPRCISGQIELMPEEIKAIEAEQCNERT
jgi:hypothetical protein